ncbi:hypothetical protein AC68_1332 [Escherichia coli 2-156-04_S4_C1]|nr:hypothetical protein AC68_1332 [Escherichia coli 2-156-04_S4_C1]
MILHAIYTVYLYSVNGWARSFLRNLFYNHQKSGDASPFLLFS